MLELLAALGLVAGWVAAWLNWSFHGEVRHAIVAALPAKWRGGLSRDEVLDLSHDDLLVHLCATSTAPEFLNRLLCCSSCMSAHIGAVGTILAWFALSLPVAAVPLVWAGGAYCGLQLFKKFET